MEVPAVDVDPDPAELVHHLREAAEVDRDQVIDREPGELLDRRHGAGGAAVGVRRVDLLPADEAVGARHVDREIAREGEDRDGGRVRLRADEHDRVRARSVGLAEAAVVADHERDRRLARIGRPGKLLGRLLVRLRLRRDCLKRVVEPQVDAAGDPAGQHQDDGADPGCDPPGDAPAAVLRQRLPVDADRRIRPGRENRPAVAVDGGATADSSFQCRSHAEKKKSAYFAPSRLMRISHESGDAPGNRLVQSFP